MFNVNVVNQIESQVASYVANKPDENVLHKNTYTTRVAIINHHDHDVLI